jgi:hypothetical protein
MQDYYSKREQNNSNTPPEKNKASTGAARENRSIKGQPARRGEVNIRGKPPPDRENAAFVPVYRFWKCVSFPLSILENL